MSQKKLPLDRLDHPKIRTLFNNLFTTLIVESDRGAVLVGTDYVDQHLRCLFEMVIPHEMIEKKQKSLLNYPGPLSSLSAKTEVAFATRLINRTIYDSIHALRRIRNKAAHNSHPFNLRTQKDEIRKMYVVLGDGLPDFINSAAIEMLLDIIVKALLGVYDPNEQKPYFNTPGEVIEYISEDPKMMSVLEEQLPKYELVIGISILCALIVSHREEAAALVGSDLTLSRLHTKFCRDGIFEAIQEQKSEDVQ
jgi:hypothetical protein